MIADLIYFGIGLLVGWISYNRLAGSYARFGGKTRVVDSHNVIGVIRGCGREANAAHENIVVTCHHDAPFASAVEDASGLAVLLALARGFAAGAGGPRSLRRDLVFVASSGKPKRLRSAGPVR